MDVLGEMESERQARENGINNRFDLVLECLAVIFRALFRNKMISKREVPTAIRKKVFNG